VLRGYWSDFHFVRVSGDAVEEWLILPLVFDDDALITPSVLCVHL
jgi:hypothetical protein